MNKGTYFYESVSIDKRILTELQKLIVCVHQVNPFQLNCRRADNFRILQFIDLFDEGIYSDYEPDKRQAIKRFCLNLLDLFCFSKEDINKNFQLDAFLDNFSCNSIDNQIDNTQFDQPGRYNILDSNPIIKIKENLYFVPYILNVFKAIYETPYYWWMEANKHSNNSSLKN